MYLITFNVLCKDLCKDRLLNIVTIPTALPMLGVVTTFHPVLSIVPLVAGMLTCLPSLFITNYAQCSILNILCLTSWSCS